MKKTKNERISTLENEVAELKLIIHELRGKKSIEPSTTNTVEDIIEFEGQQYRKVDREAREGDVVIFHVNDTNPNYSTVNNPYKVAEDFGDHVRFIGNDGGDYAVYTHDHNRRPETTDVYELIESKPLTQNQQRAEIIEKAKKFVEATKQAQLDTSVLEGGNELFNVYRTTTEFIVDVEKRTVVALIRYKTQENSGPVRGRGIAKCNLSDVFNEHIGRAIALGRALGLDVSEFEQAVQPTEFVVGQIVKVMDTNDDKVHVCGELVGVQSQKILNFSEQDYLKFFGVTYKRTTLMNSLDATIINDTDAKYKVGEQG